jgi:hypothetical protein
MQWMIARLGKTDGSPNSDENPRQTGRHHACPPRFRLKTAAMRGRSAHFCAPWHKRDTAEQTQNIAGLAKND